MKYLHCLPALLINETEITRASWNDEALSFTTQMIVDNDLEDDLPEKTRSLLTISTRFWWGLTDMANKNDIMKMPAGTLCHHMKN